MSIHANTRGQALVIVVMLLFVVAVLLGAFLSCLSGYLHFTSRTESGSSARALAESGVQYALHQFRHGDWLDKARPFTYESPDIGDGSKFTLAVEDSETDSEIQVTSVGEDGPSGAKKNLVATITNPRAITDYVLSVLNSDYDTGEIMPSAAACLGSDGVASGGYIQELHAIPRQAGIALIARTDPSFAGVTPGSECVCDSLGNYLSRTDQIPPKSGAYCLDYASGSVLFAQADAGRLVSLTYDYDRRVPTGTGIHTVVLPYAPLREGADYVMGMQRTPQPPAARGCYRPDYLAGALQFAEQDGGAVASASFSFLGARVTGGVRVNGDLELHNTVLFCLFGSLGQRISVSGRIKYGSGCNATICNDEGQRTALTSQTGSEGLVREGVPAFAMPQFAMGMFRALACRGGGGSLYIENPKDVEMENVRAPIGTTADSHEKKAAPWSSYSDSLYKDWADTGSGNWKDGVYTPAGSVVDLSRVFSDKLSGNSGIVFAEGNLIVRGTLPDGKRLLLVSARNIYLEGSPIMSRSSSIALIADGNVCINLSRLQPRTSSSPPITYYLNAVVFARRGALAVIPGSQPDNRLVLHGSFFVNRLYPNMQWASTFRSIDWIHDASYKRPPRLPAELIQVSKWEE